MTKHHPTTLTRQIIARWPSRGVLASDLAVDIHVVHHWWIRDSIPVERFAEILSAARKRKIRLTLKELADTKVPANRQLGNCSVAVQGVECVAKGIPSDIPNTA